jgi:hypothetical protein
MAAVQRAMGYDDNGDNNGGGRRQCARAVVVQQQICQSNEINNKSLMRVTLFLRQESDLSSFRTMIR